MSTDVVKWNTAGSGGCCLLAVKKTVCPYLAGLVAVQGQSVFLYDMEEFGRRVLCVGR